ncbi:MAG: hypothetical protein VX733_15495 [Candidatus Latescibacterota bacterium]|nr:hypothetical protein [Candidatus Latescibacterota bacterium]
MSAVVGEPHVVIFIACDHVRPPEVDVVPGEQHLPRRIEADEWWSLTAAMKQVDSVLRIRVDSSHRS